MIERTAYSKCEKNEELEIKDVGIDNMKWSEEQEAFVNIHEEKVEIFLECGMCGETFQTDGIQIINKRHTEQTRLNRRVAEIGMIIGSMSEDLLEYTQGKKVSLEHIIWIARESLQKEIGSEEIEVFMREKLFGMGLEVIGEKLRMRK